MHQALARLWMTLRVDPVRPANEERDLVVNLPVIALNVSRPVAQECFHPVDDLPPKRWERNWWERHWLLDDAESTPAVTLFLRRFLGSGFQAIVHDLPAQLRQSLGV